MLKYNYRKYFKEDFMRENKFGKQKFTVLLLFGMIGQIAWSVENMYFNLFVFNTISPNLEAVTLMVQLSGVMATVATLFAGTISDKLANRRSFMSWGYVIWGLSVALFGFISVENTMKILSTTESRAITVTLAVVIIGDCIMTLFGSSANDAAFNAWVTDNTQKENRGRIEGVIAILPLLAMLIVAGGFGILVEAIGYKMLFLTLGILISACGVFGVFYIKDKEGLEKNGSVKDIFYGFKPSVIKNHPTFYVSLILILIYGVACQIFMPYLIIYMQQYLSFSVLEYSIIFGAAIVLGAIVNLFLTRLSDKKDKVSMLYFASAIMSAGLFGMYFTRGIGKVGLLILFGVFGFVMITGYILVSALCGSVMRDHTPKDDVGKLQGVRMVFAVLIPMLVGPMIGNAINKTRNIPLPDLSSADSMTTQYIPAPEIFLAGAIVTLIMVALIPILKRLVKEKKDDTCD